MPKEAEDRAVIVEGEITPDTVKKLMLGIVLVIVVWFGISSYNTWSMGEEIPVQEAVKQIKEGKISEVVIDQDTAKLTNKDGKKTYVTIESKSSFSEMLQRDGIKLYEIDAKITVAPTPQVTFWDIISLFLIIATVYGIYSFINILRKQSGGGGGLLSFGKSPARVIIGKRPDVTFNDVAGAKEAKMEIKEIVDFLRDPKRFFAMGARIPRGVLLVGEPGTGKTLLARAIAGEARVPFFHTSGPEFEEMLVGAGAARVRDLFKRAKNLAPSIIFIDEIDAVARRRGMDLKSSNTEQTLNQILVEMDGFEKRDSVIVVAATNRPDVLDSAILRPGRFDRTVKLGLPDLNEREEILKVHARNKKVGESIDLHRVAQMTIGFSGADLENLLNEAAILAVRAGKTQIDDVEMKEATLKVSLGPRRASMMLTEESIRSTAYHEAGHAIVSTYLKNAEAVRTISVVPRGMALGVTYSMGEIDKVNETLASLRDKISVISAGRVAEEIVYGLENISTGAANDIQKSTKIANMIIKHFGMNKKAGFVMYDNEREWEIFANMPKYSEETSRILDEEVRTIVTEQYEIAKKIIMRERKLLDEIVKNLMEKESINEDEFNIIVEKFGVEKPPAKEKPKVLTVEEWLSKSKNSETVENTKSE